MLKSDCFEFGYLVKTHGLDGNVQAFFDVEDPDRYAGIDAVFLEINNALVPYFITKIKHFDGSRFLLKFEEIDDKDAALELKGIKMFLPVDFLPELEEGRFYFHDVIGYQVEDSTHGDLGKVQEFVDAGPQTIMVVVKGEQEVLIPLHDDFLGGVLHKEKLFKVNLPNGLVDVYLNAEEE